MNPDSDIFFMQRAAALARRGEGKTNPNPLVGAVIVRDGQIIGEGWHAVYGAIHAERAALEDCLRRGESPEGACLYVTLEPCCHYGKQPPCTQAVLNSGISRVVIGSRDPNPLVSGKGVALLRQAGIEVVEECLKDKCDAMNDIFFHYISTRLPFVALKYACTADGKIATVTGASRWITGEGARRHVHLLRNRYAAVLVGIGTVLADNPLLNCRLGDFSSADDDSDFGETLQYVQGRNPLRVIVDSNLRIPLDSQIVRSASDIPTLVACTSCGRKASGTKALELERFGVKILVVPGEKRVSLPELFKALGGMGIDSVLVEGGSELNFSLIESGLVNKVYAFFAPKIFGGVEAPGPVGGGGMVQVADAFSLELSQVRCFGQDVLLEYAVASGTWQCGGMDRR